jgi:hypothetical protein
MEAICSSKTLIPTTTTRYNWKDCNMNLHCLENFNCEHKKCLLCVSAT